MTVIALNQQPMSTSISSTSINDHRGYALVAPLTADGMIDDGEYRKSPKACIVRHFAPDEDAYEGRLAKRGDRWFFDYGDQADAGNRC